MGTCEKFPGVTTFWTAASSVGHDGYCLVTYPVLYGRPFYYFYYFVFDSLAIRRCDVRSGSVGLSYVIMFDCGGYWAIAGYCLH
jgi:hypothetical protein